MSRVFVVHLQMKTRLEPSRLAGPFVWRRRVKILSRNTTSTTRCITQADTVDIKLNIYSDPVEIAKADEALVTASDTTVREVFATLQLHDTGSVLICDDNKLVGIFTERDALRLMAEDADLDVPVRDVMKTPVTISRDAPIAEAIQMMSSRGYRRMPIVDDNGSLAGIIKVSGILHYFVDHFPETVLNLPPEPNMIMPEREGA